MSSVIGIAGIISVLNPLLPDGIRIAWGAVAGVSLFAGWFVWDRALRSAAARNAQRSEKPGDSPGARLRTYHGYAYDIAVEWFERDAKLLMPKGYRVADARWESLEESHPVRYVALRVLGLLTRGTNWGQYGGVLTVTYELGSTQDQAAAALTSFRRRLRDGPP